MDMNTSYPIANAAGGRAMRENSARKPFVATVPFRARKRGGAAHIDIALASDSAPWLHPTR